jgi:hypothetical protein
MSAMMGASEGLGDTAYVSVGSRAAVNRDTCFVGLVAKAAEFARPANVSNGRRCGRFGVAGQCLS